ncbi:MAG: bacillithiol biosynthesis cysteine-adding enzyme BshC [Bacillota bacterium]
MSFRIVTTPLAATSALPAERAGGFPSALLPACIPAAGTEAALERLRDPRVLAVTTGQQPALFTGPLYTVHKALSAAALARELERRWKRPVVPIFWVAGDDHDFAEAAHAAWIGADGAIRRATLRQRPADAPMLPLYREPLGSDVDGALADIAASLPESEFRDETLAWLTRHYQPAATIAAAFSGALAELLAPYGIVCLASTHSAFKQAAAPYLIRALEASGPLDAELAARSAELVAAGRDPGVATGGDATLVMIEGAAGRDRLMRSPDGFTTRRGEEQFTLGELRDVAARNPERLSANVLLRPAIESALLPTVAYAGGPGELRYLALTPPIYGRLGVPRQTPVPRWSGIVVGARVDRALSKFGLTLEDLARPVATLESRVVRSRLPAAVDLDLSELQALLTDRYTALRDTAGRIDPTLVRMIDAQRERALAGVARVERKLVSHLRRRIEVELRQLTLAHNAIYPDGVPQERVLSVPSFLARHGRAVLDATLDAASDWYRGALESSARPA